MRTSGGVTVCDEWGEVHTLSGSAETVLYLALLAMDARLRPGGCYRQKADEVYAVLAGSPGYEKGIEELRKLFELGARQPWLMP